MATALETGCTTDIDSEDPSICILDDGAEVPCDWTCLTGAGVVVHCDDEAATRACYCTGPGEHVYVRDRSAEPVEQGGPTTTQGGKRVADGPSSRLAQGMDSARR